VSARTVGKYTAGSLVCLLFGYFAFVRGTRVPLLGLVDLGFHEFGHLVSYLLPVPDVVEALMGSVTQILVPLGLAVYFLGFRHDLLGGGVCLAWAGTSAQDVSVYVADAPYERLPLIGGYHDWAAILGPEHFNALDSAGTVAAIVEGLGMAFLLAGLAVCVAGPFVEERRRRASEAAAKAKAGPPAGGWAVVPPWEQEGSSWNSGGRRHDDA